MVCQLDDVAEFLGHNRNAALQEAAVVDYHVQFHGPVFQGSTCFIQLDLG